MNPYRPIQQMLVELSKCLQKKEKLLMCTTTNKNLVIDVKRLLNQDYLGQLRCSIQIQFHFVVSETFYKSLER